MRLTSVLLFMLLSALSALSFGAKAAPAQQDPPGEVYIVQAGDSLSTIAQRQLGDAHLWPQILEATNQRANDDLSFAKIENPQLLRTGQRLWIPRSNGQRTSTATPSPLPKSTVSPPPEPRTELVPASPDGELFGYVDSTNHYVIAPRFVIAGDFHEERAAVSEDGINFGFIDPSGAMVVPATFGNVGFFADGLAPAIPEPGFASNMDDFVPAGYIDRAGNWVIPPQYLRVEPFSQGIARVLDQEDHFVYLDTAGNVLQRYPAQLKGSSGGIVLGREIDLVIEDNWYPTRAGTCQNQSDYLQHPQIWQCVVDETVYDPCLVAEDSRTIVCREPFHPFTDRFIAATLTEAIVPTDDLDQWLYGLWLAGVGGDAITCMRLPDPSGMDLLIDTDDDAVADPSDPAMYTYHCSDGSFLVGEPWYVEQRERWFVEQVVVGEEGDQPQQLTIVSINEIIDMTTAVVGPGGGPSDIIPLGIYFSQY